MATVVFDADGVLWRGIILYGDAIQVTPGVPEVLKELKKRGHRVVICSRNDKENLTRMLVQQGLSEHVDVVWGSWGPKSEGFQTFYHEGDPTIFLDDDPFNLEEVGRLFPEVDLLHIVPEEWAPLELLNYGPLAKEEDRYRVRLLREQQARQAAEKVYSGDYQTFLRSTDLQLTIYSSRETIPDLGRALDLLNRTNELRTNKTRYETLPLNRDLFGASLVDRFGDYGVIGVGLVDRGQLASGGGVVILEDLAISCRTMGRGIGSVLVAWLCRHAVEEWEARGVLGYLRVSEKNTSMRDLYQFLGFTCGLHTLDERAQEAELETWFWRASQKLSSFPDWMQVTIV